MVIASYAALALALQIMENLILPAQVIWLRIGIANVITVVLLYKFGFKIAIHVVFIRIIIASIILGTFLSPPFWMSFCGGITSVSIMGLVLNSYIKKFIGVIGLSVIGAVCHNITQIIIAILFLGFSIAMINYILPIVILFAIGFGSITGYLAYKVLN
jgi:heptaprenyl diphosphate synthase